VVQDGAAGRKSVLGIFKGAKQGEPNGGGGPSVHGEAVTGEWSTSMALSSSVSITTEALSDSVGEITVPCKFTFTFNGEILTAFHWAVFGEPNGLLSFGRVHDRYGWDCGRV